LLGAETGREGGKERGKEREDPLKIKTETE
jgi:hypothetical protein